MNNYKELFDDYIASNRSPESESKLVKELSKNGDLERYGAILSGYELQDNFETFMNSTRELVKLNNPAMLSELLFQILMDDKIPSQAKANGLTYVKQCVEANFDDQISTLLTGGSNSELDLFFNTVLDSPDRLNIVIKIFLIVFGDQQVPNQRKSDFIKIFRTVARVKSKGM